MRVQVGTPVFQHEQACQLTLCVEQGHPLGTLAGLAPLLLSLHWGFAGACDPCPAAGCSTSLHLVPADNGVCAIVNTGQAPCVVCRAVLPMPATALACLVYAPLARGSACG